MKENTKKPNIQKAILKVLAEKTAISEEYLKHKLIGNVKNQKNYALNRSIKNLVHSELIEIYNSDNKKYLRLSKKGRNKLNCIRLEGEEALVSTSWDGFWRIIILDIPENRKSEREALRYLLKKANFVCVKNTVWISPFPYEYLFENIKKDLGLGMELMIIITNNLDEETRKTFFIKMKEAK